MNQSYGNCQCSSSSTLIIPRTQASRIVAALILVAFFIFVAGYFLGKRRAVDEIAGRLESDTFADRLHYAMSGLYDIPKDEGESSVETAESGCDAEGTECAENDQAPQQEPTVAVAHEEATLSSDYYYAALVGFKEKKSANAFASRVNRKSKGQIDLTVVERTSATARGKKIAWYQVVTPSQPSQHAVEKLVESIKQLPEIVLNDVKIVKTTV
jgi:hypothetical protein